MMALYLDPLGQYLCTGNAGQHEAIARVRAAIFIPRDLRNCHYFLACHKLGASGARMVTGMANVRLRPRKCHHLCSFSPS